MLPEFNRVIMIRMIITIITIIRTLLHTYMLCYMSYLLYSTVLSHQRSGCMDTVKITGDLEGVWLAAAVLY